MKKKKQLIEHTNDSNPAANLIRSKLDNAYSNEPDVAAEEKEITNTGAHSKHQEFMKKLLASGKSYLDIQAAWHSYYLSLPDSEKHDVWREFYSLQNRQTTMVSQINPSANTVNKFISGGEIINNDQKVSEIKRNIKNKISADGKLTIKHHLKSLVFGLSMAGIFALMTAFTLFNQLFIGPFVTPSLNASATPIINVSSDVTVSPDTKIIIPKLNVEAPIVTDATGNDEPAIQKALQRGVVLYPNTGKPGEKGNQVIFGHSSNNLFNKGDYKYVFVLLGKLDNGDIIYINYQSKQYTYKVINKKIVKPSDVGVLAEQPAPSIITLITCDPPGANVNRLVVQAEQINPKPENNKPSTAQTSNQPKTLAGSPESLFKRIIDWIIN